MMGFYEFTMFLGWCTVVNMGILVIATLFLTLFKRVVIRFHSKAFGINASELPTIYFNYLANYKIVVLVFNFAPYLALKIMI